MLDPLPGQERRDRMQDKLVSDELRKALDSPRLRHRLVQAALNRRREEAVVKNKENTRSATDLEISGLRRELESNGFSTFQYTDYDGEKFLSFRVKGSSVLYNTTINEISATLIGPNINIIVTGSVSGPDTLLSFIYGVIEHIDR